MKILMAIILISIFFCASLIINNDNIVHTIELEEKTIYKNSLNDNSRKIFSFMPLKEALNKNIKTVEKEID